jgi:lipid-A-disaccharide synthase
MNGQEFSAEQLQPLKVFLVVGEESGDQLGAGLMRALLERLGGRVSFSGVGGAAMAGEGLTSLFPLADVALMGFVSVVKHLPTLLERINEATAAAIAAQS